VPGSNSTRLIQWRGAGIYARTSLIYRLRPAGILAFVGVCATAFRLAAGALRFFAAAFASRVTVVLPAVFFVAFFPAFFRAAAAGAWDRAGVLLRAGGVVSGVGPELGSDGLHAVLSLGTAWNGGAKRGSKRSRTRLRANFCRWRSCRIASP